MLNQFKEEVETYPEEDGKSYCVLCGACVDGLDSHTCSCAQGSDTDRRPIIRSAHDDFDDEAAWADALHNHPTDRE